jgi:hypothetical protein
MPVHLQQYFAKWPAEGVVDFGQEFAKLVTLTAARTLLGALRMHWLSALFSFSVSPRLEVETLDCASFSPAQAVRFVSTSLRRLPT